MERALLGHWGSIKKIKLLNVTNVSLCLSQHIRIRSVLKSFNPELILPSVYTELYQSSNVMGNSWI